MSDAAFRAHLATGSTSVSRCWRVTRRDGVVVAATDHDRDLAFDGTVFEAAAAFGSSEIATSLGLAVNDSEIAGAISTPRITTADLRRGLYDGARVEVFDVDWSDVASRKLRAVFTLGEVERSENAFRAELRSRINRLGQPEGRSFLPLCDAALGNARCRVDLSGESRRGAGVVVSASGRLAFRASGLESFAPAAFARGLVEWSSGANAGEVSEVRAFSAGGLFDLWRAPAYPIAAGDAFSAVVGCDKSFATCRDRFANAANFRGFPHMPGSEAVVSYARAGDPKQDGSPY